MTTNYGVIDAENTSKTSTVNVLEPVPTNMKLDETKRWPAAAERSGAIAARAARALR